MSKDDSDRLEAYRRKRSAGGTTEPFGTGEDRRARLFVVQKHAARNLHFDLRLEIAGVLHSWAVPKGPSLDPQTKRLAMEVEDHPIEYADFEGTIPEDNYGAGAVIVFDRGQWVCHGEPEEGLRRGKLLFDLHGYKLRGRWTLFRTKGEENAWLLMKKPDAFADPDPDAELPQQSILSGRTVEQLLDGDDPAEETVRRMDAVGAPKGRVDPFQVDLMLARIAEAPFDKEGWTFELKYDGFRLIASNVGGTATLRYRRGQAATAVFPEIAGAVGTLALHDLVLDGEVVVLDETGRPNFQRLQQRVHLRRKIDVDRASVTSPATLFVFDVLSCEGRDLRSLPLVQRRAILERIVPPLGPLQIAAAVPREGRMMFDEVRKLGFEGIVAKNTNARYLGGRSDDWLKIRADRTGDFLVVGFTRPKGSRSSLGALHLAVRSAEGLAYAGRVGSGLTDRALRDLRTELDHERVDRPPAVSGLPSGEDHVWVEPRRLVEVRYKEWTGAGHLRQPVFLRRREDKGPDDCDHREDEEPRPEPPEPASMAEPRVVRFSNLDKIFWPRERYTKGDLIEYYRSVSGWLIPWLRDRPLVLTRYPDGIEGKNFFQKDAPVFAPDWIRTETMWSEHAQREIRYFVCDDEESLLYLINLGTIPLHLWSSRIGSLQHPDWCILDLDPKGAPFTHVVRVARTIERLCREIDLPVFVKTSGSSGLHLLVPLGRLCTYDQSRAFAELLARIVVTELPEISTIARPIAARDGRVYVDYLQNGHGRLLVSPLCVRPLDGAPVSMPLAWREVGARLDPARYTIRTAPGRLKRRRIDPWEGLLTLEPDLAAALEALAARLGAG